jgi:hypothetical protein
VILLSLGLFVPFPLSNIPFGLNIVPVFCLSGRGRRIAFARASRGPLPARSDACDRVGRRIRDLLSYDMKGMICSRDRSATQSLIAWLRDGIEAREWSILSGRRVLTGYA